MALPHIKLIWGGKKKQPGRWYAGLFGFYQPRSGRGEAIAVSVRGVLCWGILLGAIAWVAGATTIYYRWQARPYNFVTWTDCLLYPARKDAINAKRGQATLAEAFDDLKNRQYNSAIAKLRIGLNRYPQDSRARLELAKMFLAWSMRPHAVKLLSEGMDFGYPGRTYLELAFALAAQGEDYELWIDLCQQAIDLANKTSGVSEADKRWLSEQLVKALFAADRHEEALAYADQSPDLLPALRNELKILALLSKTDKTPAVAAAEAWVAREPQSSQALRILARCYREQGDNAKLVATLARLRANEPTDPQGYAFSVIQMGLAGDKAAAAKLLDDYIFRFGSVPANYIVLGTALGQTGELDLINTLDQEARLRGFRLGQLELARLQALIKQKQWTQARQVADTLRRGLPEDAVQQVGTIELLSRLIAAAADSGESSQTALIEHLSGRQLPLATYRQIIETLTENGRDATARRIVTFADGAYPSSPWLAQEREKLDTAARARQDALAARDSSRPGTAIAASASEFYRQFDQLVTSGDLSAANRLIRETRQARPDWLSAETNELAFRELKLVTSEDDLLRIQLQARTYLNGDRNRTQNATTLAQSLYGTDRKPGAILLIKEVLRRTPDYAPARRLLDVWEPKPKPKPADPAPAPPAASPAAEAAAPATP
ncbi:hypothetical protein OpiT1DRAFT_05123 [Opitutaceae bacterium TAV1]|nr:hypothetical protein OPIT5_23500 [Opitutaceae bacterium TAV5]EIQ00576.1 hypothetical protein OpiT1DRAFT_05123 [Opitutaceae bacterium TAV1]